MANWRDQPYERKYPAPCATPGCPAITKTTYCDKHQRPRIADQQADQKEYDRRRGRASSRGYGSKWRKARADYLGHNPLCVRCFAMGRVKAATIVDHIIDHHGDQGLFWDNSNWQSLCFDCHEIKHHRRKA